MIAPRKPIHQTNSIPAWHAKFLELLPGIQRYARHAFRNLWPEVQADLTQEVIANCLVAFVHLVDRGKGDIAFATPLAMFAVRQVHAGRRVGTRLNVRDVSSPYAQLAKSIRLERLDHYDSKSEEWREIVIEDRHATPADVARVRIDFHDWLQALSRRRRQIAQLLASGETTHTVAKRFRLSDGRISQLRRELADSWLAFQGEEPSIEGAV
jgi:RNA polymerase sigma factor (sigma-70 family)